MNRILKHKLIYYTLNYKAVDNGEITLFDVFSLATKTLIHFVMES